MSGSEHLDARACAQAELAIEGALLRACVISVAVTVDGSGSIEIVRSVSGCAMGGSSGSGC